MKGKLWLNGRPVGPAELEGVFVPPELDMLRGLLSEEHSICSASAEEGGGKGAVMLGLNAYDSAFFSSRIGNMSYAGDRLSDGVFHALLARVVAEAGKDGYFYIYFKVPQKQSFLESRLLSGGFKTCGASVDLFLDLRGRRGQGPGGNVRLASGPDEKPLSEIASRAFKRSRMYGMGFVPPEKVDEYHAKWIVNLMRSGSDKVFVPGKEGPPAGFLALRVDEAKRTGRIILLAVDEKHRREGVGRALLGDVMNWAAGKLDGIYVKTQEHNIPAVKYYEKCGFNIVEREGGFHLILKA